MTILLRYLALCMITGLLLSGLDAFGQGVTTSSDVQIDASSGMVTGTCETDLNDDSDSYYLAKVNCVLTDGSGNSLASGNQVSSTGAAIVVLQVQGMPGTTYIVNGFHSSLIQYKYDDVDPDERQPTYPTYIDEFNFASLDGGQPAPYNPAYYYEGPGPEEITKTQFEILGQTTSKGIRYYTQGELTNLIAHAQSLFSSKCDAKFAAVVPSYSNAGFFASLQATTFYQYPYGATGAPASNGADAATLVNDPGRPIELFPNFYPYPGQTANFQEFVLIHEGLHHFTGWGDYTSKNGADFETQFYGGGYRRTNPGSGDFTVWLMNSCPP